MRRTRTSIAVAFVYVPAGVVDAETPAVIEGALERKHRVMGRGHYGTTHVRYDLAEDEDLDAGVWYRGEPVYSGGTLQAIRTVEALPPPCVYFVNDSEV